MIGKIFTRKHLAVMVATITALALLITSAFATEPGAEVTITGSTLSGGDVGFANLSGIMLDGSAKTATANWTIANIVDARGSGAGWNTTLQLSQFSEWAAEAYVVSGNVLALSSLVVTTAPVVAKADTTSSDPTLVSVVASETPLDTATPVKLLSSDVNEGMGSFTVSDMTVTLNVPANVLTGTYKTDATVALVTGP